MAMEESSRHGALVLELRAILGGCGDGNILLHLLIFGSGSKRRCKCYSCTINCRDMHL
jgi:hypothetical protein